jgi:hypothetical protein
MVVADIVCDLLHGPLFKSGLWPLSLDAVVGDLRRRFLPKGQLGRGYRAISRNGRVLLASSLPLADWIDQAAQVRLQTWHKAILPGERPRPYGILLCLRPAGRQLGGVLYQCRLTSATAASLEPFHLQLDVGGGMFLTMGTSSRADTVTR